MDLRKHGMLVRMKTCMPLLLVLPVLALAQGEEKRALRNLPPAPKGGRFAALTDFVWPEKPGDADICLWKDDKFAACSITIDDNCAPDHDWWLEQAEKHGFKLTWFVITDRVDGPNGFDGTWAGWQRLADAGHSIQSHTTNHKHGKNSETPLTEEQLRAMYKDSLDAINAHVTNNVACCIAYPSGDAHADIAKDYAIACRGVGGAPSTANGVNYLNTDIGGFGQGCADVLLTGHTDAGPAWLNKADRRYLRGWIIPLSHLVHWGKTPDVQAESAEKMAKQLEYLGKNGDRFWFGTFDTVAKYGQERDTAELKTVSVAANSIEFSLVDRMDDTLFNVPLTVKVRLPDGWKDASARQGDAVAPCRVVEHDGARFALVDAVPDRGAVFVKQK